MTWFERGRNCIEGERCLNEGTLQRGRKLTRWLLSKDCAGIVIVHRAYGKTPSRRAALPAPRLLSRWRGAEKSPAWGASDGGERALKKRA